MAESMKDFEKELEESYKVMGDGEKDTDTLLAWEKIKELYENQETLDVTVSGVRAVRPDADGHHRPPVLGEFGRFDDRPAEFVLVEDQVVCRRHDHRRIRIDRFQPPGGIGDARGRVASHRFAEHLALPDFRNVPQYLLFITVVGHDQEIFRRNDSGEPFVGVPDEAFSGSEDVEELFRCRTAADRPETAADASGHDDAVSVVVHMLFAVLSYNITAFYRDNQTGSP